MSLQCSDTVGLETERASGCKNLGIGFLVVTIWHTDTQIFTGRIPFLSSNQQCHSTEGRKYHIPWTCSSQTHLETVLFYFAKKFLT